MVTFQLNERFVSFLISSLKPGQDCNKIADTFTNTKEQYPNSVCIQFQESNEKFDPFLPKFTNLFLFAHVIIHSSPKCYLGNTRICLVMFGYSGESVTQGDQYDKSVGQLLIHGNLFSPPLSLHSNSRSEGVQRFKGLL